MRNLDFSSWSAILSTLLGLALITVIGVGVRLLVMATIQQRRERENRQINERLKTLIAAYKTLGGSITGDLAVDPTHLRDLRKRQQAPVSIAADDEGQEDAGGSDRGRRTRDAVEAALSDIILLGTDDHVRLASKAAHELVAGRQVHTAELVISLRDFIRHALGLHAVPADVIIPAQGPTRTTGGASKGRGESGGRQGGGGRGGGGMAMGMGVGGLGMGAAAAGEVDDTEQPPSSATS